MTDKLLSPLPAYHLSVVRLQCSACGAEANASCNCGKPYVPARQRAADAIQANPDKSDRAIAGEIGVGKDTVRRARASTGAPAPVDVRIGKDGKARRLPSHVPGDEKLPPDPMQDEDIIDQIENLFEQLTRDGQVRCALRLRKMAFGDT
jgi:hypothetical protein